MLVVATLNQIFQTVTAVLTTPGNNDPVNPAVANDWVVGTNATKSSNAALYGFLGLVGGTAIICTCVAAYKSKTNTDQQ